jgi:predicted dehydrogenase
VTKVVRVGVIGAGHLGALHAEKYARRSDVRLVSMYDVDRERCKSVAERIGCAAAGDEAELLSAVDAVTIAVPVLEHAPVGMRALAAGCHVLMEKPLAATCELGERLTAAARKAGVVLQVGHVERFNPVIQELRHIVKEPRFVECHRLAPFAGRGIDTDVVLDVMIHDLDLLEYLVGDEIVAIDAVGVPVLSSHVDIANARLRFRGGCVANVTASRASLKKERKLRIFQADTYVSMDFDARSALIARRVGDAVVDPRGRLDMNAIRVETREFGDADPLAAEVDAFVAAVRGECAPAVDADDAMSALRLAERIRESMEVPNPPPAA